MAEAENTARPASEERGEVSLVLDGATMALRPSYEAIFAFEASTDKGLLELARAALEGKMRLADLSQVVTECIRAWGRATQQPSIAASNAVRIGQLIVEAEGGMARVLGIVSGMLSMAVTGNFTASGEVKAGTTTTSEVPAES
ncbi:GTA-gp10 family protein [Novosphingobium sp. EMRT-2]|uniref:GTA-gp10 family protein n=1 Tax=Novosphingobium sp. EMRT-2 TaxID=2571749 RepID=UPI0010BD1941|nr:GTA-gp10 family protein [Novosphingobium sp. EMRT-2]QCI92315.1 gene transfer agent family protein [Novosphingobium sp. EMRT-2]